MSAKSRYRTIGVAGAGAFGTALALAAARAGGASCSGLATRETVASLREKREAPRLPGAKLPEAIEPTSDIALLAGVEALIPGGADPGLGVRPRRCWRRRCRKGCR